MKTRFSLAAAFCLVFAGAASAQEHFTEGPVWECSSYRIKPDQGDNYLKYLRENSLPQQEERKKAGLILDWKVFFHTPTSPTDPDVVICTLHSSFARLDYNAGDDAKSKGISAKHFKTTDEQKQLDMIAKRLAMRDFMGSTYYREVKLKPTP
jgi:hypothetical protein